MKSKYFYDEVFQVSVLAFHGTSKQMAIKSKLLGIDYEPNEGAEGALQVQPNNNGFILWLKQSDDFYALLHETVHLTTEALAEKAINTELITGDEVFAYYQAYWFRRLWRFFSGIKKGKK